MSRRTLLERHNNKLDEEIRAKDATSNEGALMTLIKGKRDVAFFVVSKRFRKILEKYKLGIIPVRMEGIDSMHAIVYRNKEKALKLYKIALAHGGYIKDKTAEEAREIGNLLGYFKEDIDQYIDKHYGFHAPIINEPSPDDFDDLSEQKKPQTLNKKIIRTIIDPKGNKIKICTVSGTYVKGTLGFIEFVEGGHHYVDSHPGYKKYIPEDEIWIDEVFLNSPEDFVGILSHEWLERNRMKYKDQSYDKSHEIANAIEKKIRKNKLMEDAQFKETLSLMKRLRVFIYLLLFTWLFV